MKLLYSFIALILISSCSSSDSEMKKYNDDDPRSLIGKWEIIKEYHENQLIFDLTDQSQNHSNHVIEGMKKNYLHFLSNGKITGGIWINPPNKPITCTTKGIYKIDDQKLGIEIPRNGSTCDFGGTFRWKIKNNHLYLYSLNHKGKYKVYRRAE